MILEYEETLDTKKQAEISDSRSRISNAIKREITKLGNEQHYYKPEQEKMHNRIKSKIYIALCATCKTNFHHYLQNNAFKV